MRKIFAILLFVFGFAFVLIPFIPFGCNDVTASADVVSGYRFSGEPSIAYQRGLTLSSGSDTVEFPDVYYLSFGYSLGGINYGTTQTAHYVYIPFRLMLTDNGYLQFSYPYYNLTGGLVPTSFSNHILFQLNNQSNIEQSSSFVSYSSQNAVNNMLSGYLDTYRVSVYYFRSNVSSAPYPVISRNVVPDMTEFVERIELRFYRSFVDVVFPLPRVVSDGVLLQDSSDYVRFRVESINTDAYLPLGTRPVSSDVLTTLTFPVVLQSDDAAYDDGYKHGYGDGFARGHDDGYDVGYADGIDVSLSDITPWEILVQQVDAFFNLSLFGSSVTFGTVLSIGFGMLLMGIAIKIFMGG